MHARNVTVDLIDERVIHFVRETLFNPKYAKVKLS